MGSCNSCGAPIRWERTTAGKRIPLDPAPVPDGNVVIVDNGDGTTMAMVLAGVALRLSGDAVPKFKSHFATCPDADSHRRGGR